MEAEIIEVGPILFYFVGAMGHRPLRAANYKLILRSR